MKIVVLSGGRSPEREISLVTGRAIQQALEDLGHQVIAVDPDVDLPSVLWQEKRSGCDFVWIALHGSGGEDGTVQALLDWLELPYQGSGYLASALAMDKQVAKRLFQSGLVPTPAWMLWNQDDPIAWEPLMESLGSVVVVKPADCGSSVGVNIVRSEDSFQRAIQQAGRYSHKILLESFIPGKEITVSILHGRVMPSIEILPVDTAFYTYEAKYAVGGSRHLIPCSLSSEGLEKTEAAARNAYHLLGCEGLARVDLRVDAQEEPWVLEVNTLPGMTPTSLCPDAAAAWGWSFQELVDQMLRLGVQRHQAVAVVQPG